MLRKSLLLLLITASCQLMARSPLIIENNKVTEGEKDPSKKICPNKSECQNVNNKDCLCYCSHECEPREKKPDEDEPVWDKDGIVVNGTRYHCFCKPWDRENTNRCMRKPAVQNKNK